MIRVTVWNERVQELKRYAWRDALQNHPETLSEEDKAKYTKECDKWFSVHPDGMNKTIGSIFEGDDNFQVTYSTLQDEDCGLSEELLANTDVLVYWAHCGHELVSDEAAQRIRQHVLGGMGFVALHSSHPCKALQLLLGSTGSLKWRDGDRERLWVVNPAHPIAQGVPEYIDLEHEEMYGEPFDIAKPDDIVFMGWFSGGEVFRSGCTWQRGNGKIFYFQPGHETNPSFHNEYIRRIIKNAVYWANPVVRTEPMKCTHPESLEAARLNK